jgi:hypothetical protein
MYQLAHDSHPIDSTRLFVDSCTSMASTTENLNLVNSVAKLIRAALDGADLKPLRDMVARIAEWSNDVDDVLAAAGQSVVDELGDVSYALLHDAVRKVAQIERDVLSPRYETGLRAVLAG